MSMVGRGQEDRQHVQPVDVKQGTNGQKVLIGTSGVVAGFIHNGPCVTATGRADLCPCQGGRLNKRGAQRAGGV